MSARGDHPLFSNVYHRDILVGVQMAPEVDRAAMHEIDGLRAELLALRTALVKWKHREPSTTWEYIEFVLNLIPDDNWGIT